MKFSFVLKYFSPARYRYRIHRLLNLSVLQSLDILMAPGYDAKLKHPPVFFLGAPRSGSTLVNQVVTDVFDMAYLSNRHCQFFGAPALAEKLFRPLKNKPPSDFNSNHGATKGMSAPSECGQWWYRFFRRTPPYVTLDDVDAKKMHDFRRSLLALTEAADKPVIFKNLYASLRLEAIAKHVPEALYIIIHRDELDNGHSLLEVRHKVFGSYDKWWSMPAPDTEELEKRPAYVQVIEQIRSIHRTILSDLGASTVSVARIHHINYEQFCSDVHAEMIRLEKFLSENACSTEMELSNVPAIFEKRDVIRIDSSLYEKMSQYVNE